MRVDCEARMLDVQKLLDEAESERDSWREQCSAMSKTLDEMTSLLRDKDRVESWAWPQTKSCRDILQEFEANSLHKGFPHPESAVEILCEKDGGHRFESKLRLIPGTESESLLYSNNASVENNRSAHMPTGEFEHLSHFAERPFVAYSPMKAVSFEAHHSAYSKEKTGTTNESFSFGAFPNSISPILPGRSVTSKHDMQTSEARSRNPERNLKL